jgi:anti-sigma B factor antagonist
MFPEWRRVPGTSPASRTIDRFPIGASLYRRAPMPTYRWYVIAGNGGRKESDTMTDFSASHFTEMRLRGAVDMEHSPAIRERLLAALRNGRDVLVDLSGVSLLDSAGVACLIEALMTAKSRGLRFTITGIGAQARRVLRLARLDKMFPDGSRRT